MKHSARLLFAIVVTAVLAATAIVVWASPLRQGTVPVPPVQLPVVLGTAQTIGTAQVTVTCVGATGTIDRYTAPIQQVGPAPTGDSYSSDGIGIKTDKVCDYKVCFPYPKTVADAGGKIFKWNSLTTTWNVVSSTPGSNPISDIEGTNPQLICVVDKGVTSGTFSLIVP